MPDDIDKLIAGLRESPDLDPMATVVLDMVVERRRQVTEEGYTAEHDDTHLTGEWFQIILNYAQLLARATFDMEEPEEYRKRLIQIGSIAIAATESYDRAIAFAESRAGDPAVDNGTA